MGKGRAPCCDKSQVKRGPWSPAEDLRLITFIQKHGHDNWRALPKQAGLLRCGKSCRLRWINYLRPDVKRGNFTMEEEEAIIKLHESLGNKWSKIASHFPGRTDNEIKNIWNTHLKKRLATKNNSDNSRGDESKESSITSSSSSATSIPSCTGKRGLEMEAGHQSDEESVPKRPCDNNNHEPTIQEKLIDQDVQKEVTTNDFSPEDQLVITSTATSSASSYGSNVSNSTNIDYDPENQMDNFLFDFIGSYDVSDILQEENKPPDIPEVIPLEADYDFWNMLDSLGTASQQPDNEQVQVLHNSKPSRISNFGDDQNNKQIQNMDWFKFLENELGLAGNDNQNDITQGVLENDRSHVMEKLVPEEYDPSLYFY